jgi:hypothetical protein
MSEFVKLYTPQDLSWPFCDHDAAPRYYVGGGSYPDAVRVDPSPAYPLPIHTVRALVEACWARFPLLGSRLDVAVLSHEVLTRTNGSMHESYISKHPDGSEWSEKIACRCGCGRAKEFCGQALTIVLSAKRIPIHPAMVRYLVAHEYGHAAYAAIARRLWHHDCGEWSLTSEYLQRRGVTLPDAGRYGGGTWHAQPQEIIANDFRVLVMDQEREFWPHPDVPMPAREMLAWWDEGLEALRQAAPVEVAHG